MRVATFNCNSIRTRMDTVLAWCRAHKPDVLGLQETKVQDHEFPLEPLQKEGYYITFRGMKTYNGVALLSREKPTDVTFGLGGPTSDPYRLVQATIGGIKFVNTYVPQGRTIDHAMFQYKLKWLTRLRKHFDRQLSPNDLVIWMGDCNVAAQPIDVHNPEKRAKHVCFHSNARAALDRCMQWGFHDVFRQFHPEPGHYSFFDYLRPFSESRGWRLDYIHASGPLARRAKDAWIDLEPRRQLRPSDHTFVAADFS